MTYFKPLTISTTLKITTTTTNHTMKKKHTHILIKIQLNEIYIKQLSANKGANIFKQNET